MFPCMFHAYGYGYGIVRVISWYGSILWNRLLEFTNLFLELIMTWVHCSRWFLVWWVMHKVLIFTYCSPGSKWKVKKKKNSLVDAWWQLGRDVSTSNLLYCVSFQSYLLCCNRDNLGVKSLLFFFFFEIISTLYSFPFDRISSYVHWKISR